MVTKYFELVFRGSIETKSVKPRQTADSNPANKVYLLKDVQFLCHCRSPKIGKTWVLQVNPSFYHSEVVKVGKMFGNASVSDF